MHARLDYLTQLHQSAPQDTFVLFALAKEHEKLGDLPQALAFYQRLQETDPGYVGVYYHLGKLHEQLHNIPEAVTTYRAGIREAEAANDAHAASELRGALINWEDPD